MDSSNGKKPKIVAFSLRASGGSGSSCPGCGSSCPFPRSIDGAPPESFSRLELLHPIHCSSPMFISNTKNHSSPAESSHCSGGSVYESAHIGIPGDGPADPVSRPHLLCACKIPLRQKTSRKERNPGRVYYVCQKSGTNESFVRKTWIWVNLVRDYVELMIKYRTRIQLEKLSALQKELDLKNEALSCSGREMAQQCLGHQHESSQLKSRLVELQTTAMKIKKIRRLTAMFVFVCWFVVPGSLVIALAATTILASMFF